MLLRILPAGQAPAGRGRVPVARLDATRREPRTTRGRALEYALFLILLFYLLPWVAAELRQHPRATTILLANVALGWTGIGWLGALAWALWRPAPEPVRYRPVLQALPGGRANEAARPPDGPGRLESADPPPADEQPGSRRAGLALVSGRGEGRARGARGGRSPRPSA